MAHSAARRSSGAKQRRTASGRKGKALTRGPRVIEKEREGARAWAGVGQGGSRATRARPSKAAGLKARREGWAACGRKSWAAALGLGLLGRNGGQGFGKREGEEVCAGLVSCWAGSGLSFGFLLSFSIPLFYFSNHTQTI